MGTVSGSGGGRRWVCMAPVERLMELECPTAETEKKQGLEKRGPNQHWSHIITLRRTLGRFWSNLDHSKALNHQSKEGIEDLIMQFIKNFEDSTFGMSG
ncbi:hypothetical protein E3N88_29639 [Mikania micrantha]|uniref:Uncharacterized protein n=1 Tax=Mikania micrantha TaxID=192012 RepID=A0A5N6MK13_9ASTR|nr:hypothetical protein E3N88_29639 [Mikania micrantha]